MQFPPAIPTRTRASRSAGIAPGRPADSGSSARRTRSVRPAPIGRASSESSPGRRGDEQPTIRRRPRRVPQARSPRSVAPGSGRQERPVGVLRRPRLATLGQQVQVVGLWRPACSQRPYARSALRWIGPRFRPFPRDFRRGLSGAGQQGPGPALEAREEFLGTPLGSIADDAGVQGSPIRV